MKHVLGMAKRHLDLRGAWGPRLKLNILRLVYAVKELRRRGDDGQGYLLDADETIKQRVGKRWREKYRADDTVRVCVVQPTDMERTALEQEIKDSRAGMIAGTLGEDAGDRSSAMQGASLIEGALKRLFANMTRVLR